MTKQTVARQETAPRLSREEELELARTIRGGGPDARSAREKMIRCNRGLVRKIASQYSKVGGLPIDDAISYGEIGLMRAVDDFDPQRGAKFSVYASFWIKRNIRDSIGTKGWRGFIVVKPTTRFRANKLKDRSLEFEREHGRTPSHRELAKLTGESERRVQRLMFIADMTCVSLEQICDEGHEIAGTNQVQTRENVDHLRWCFEKLDERAREVLGLRFGMGGKRPLTLRQVGNKLKLSSERVRQLQDRAVGQLRSLFYEEAETVSA